MNANGHEFFSPFTLPLTQWQSGVRNPGLKLLAEGMGKPCNAFLPRKGFASPHLNFAFLAQAARVAGAWLFAGLT